MTSAISIKDRLKNQAVAGGKTFQEVLTAYLIITYSYITFSAADIPVARMFAIPDGDDFRIVHMYFLLTKVGLFSNLN